MNTLTLENDGDCYEKKFLHIINNDINTYEEAWVSYISKKTNRPENIHFRDDISESDFNACKNLYSSMLFYCFSHQKINDILFSYKPSTIAPPASGSIETIAGHICRDNENIPMEYMDFITCLNFFNISVKNAISACDVSEKTIEDNHRTFLDDINKYNNYFISGTVAPYLKCKDKSAIVPKFGSVPESDWRIFRDKNNEPENYVDKFSLAADVIQEIKNMTKYFLNDVYIMYT